MAEMSGRTIYTEVNGDIRQTPDGGYILAGSSASVDCGIPGNHGGLDFWLLKLGPNGDIQWQQMLGGSGNEYATSISPAADGGYFVGGYTSSSDGQVTGYHNTGTYTFDWWVIKVDGSGNLQWQQALGGSGDYDQCFSIQATSDGGCITAGRTNSTDGDVVGNHGMSDAWVIKFNSTGAVQWNKTYGGSMSDGAWSIKLTSDGGYIFAGYTASNDGDVSGNKSLGGFNDFWVVKLDVAGGVQWQKCYGGSFNETAYYIQNTSDGGYLVTGTAESSDGDLSCNAGQDDAWIIKIGSTGNLQWSKPMGGSGTDEGFAIQPLPDGSFIWAGVTCSAEVPGYHVHHGGNGSCGDYWIVKLSAPEATPPAPVVTLSPSSGKVCAGAPATFTASIQNTGVQPIYQWTKNGQATGSGGPTYTASDFQDNDVVKVTIQSGGGACDENNAQATAAVTVHINNTILRPSVKISSGTNFLCTCAPATFNVTITGGGSSPSYLWMINGVATGTNSGSWLSNELLPTDVVTCQYSDSSGCIAGGSVLSNAITLAPGSGGASSVSISSPSGMVCAGMPATYLASPVNAGPTPIYQWQVNGVNAGTDSIGFSSAVLNNGDVVTCIITPDPLFPCATPGNASSNALVVQLAAKSDPAVSISTASAQACTGDTVSFTATTQNAGANPAYQWEVNGVATGTDAPTFAGHNFVNGDVVQCMVYIDPTDLCALTNQAASGAITLKIIDQPDPSITITASPAACAGDPISFNANAQHAGTGPSYQWLVNGLAAGGNAPVFGSTQIGNGAVITCLLIPGAGACLTTPTLSNPVVAIIFPLPQVTISPDDTTVLADGQIILHAEVSADVTSYQWSPADKLTDPLSLNPTTVALQDSVLFRLTVETADGCKATAGTSILIYLALRLPNAFTPDGNGVNDVFRIPPGINLQLEEFSIYNRWGGRIFSTRNISQGWDGTVGGHPADAGVYVYTIIGKDIKGPVAVKGTVILVR